MRSGLYKDDLARVVSADYTSGRARVKLLPRIDFAAMAEPRVGAACRGRPHAHEGACMVHGACSSHVPQP